MRKAFTLIELVVSIVVIGMAMMTLPIMMEQSSKAGEVAGMSDVYFKAQVLIKEIASKPWDAVSSTKYANGEGALFVDVANGDLALARISGSNARIGSFASDDDMRHFYSTTAIASQIPNSPSGFTSIEGFNGYKIASTNYTLTVSVAYVPDTVTQNGNSESVTWNLSDSVGVSQSTNLKKITVKAVKTIGATQSQTQLSYFSSNIGGQTVAIK